MAKITLTFPNQEAYDAYWQGQTPGSKWLCIIESVNTGGEEPLQNALITSSNNGQSGNTPVEMGQSTIDVVVDQNVTIASQAAAIEDYQEGDVVSKTEYDAVVGELNDATEITTNIKEN